jgi:preprotein translocase subunit SecE
VARDRSKGRRRRTGNAGGPEGSRAREIGFDDATIDESGLTDAVPAPDPLKNATPDVDQAKAAETGAGRGGPGEVELSDEDIFEGEDDLERAPDQVEEEPLPARGGFDPALEGRVPARPRKERGKVVTFLGHCVDELRRVQWPDRKHTGQATAVVLGFVLIAGGWLGLMDAIWKPIVNAII